MSFFNGYVILGLLLTLIGATTVFVFFVSTAIVKLIILYMGGGAVIMFAVFVAWNAKLYAQFYPLRVKAFGERYDAFTVTDDTRGKIVKDKKTGYEFIELPNGKRFKMPDRKYIMKGKDSHVNLFDTREQQFPVTLNRENLEEVHQEIIPEDQRVWFSDQVIPSIKEATRPPMSDWVQVAMIVSIIGVTILMAIGFTLGPDYLVKMNEFWGAQADKAEAKYNRFVEAIEQAPIIVDVQCKGDGSAPPVQPPG